jgi:hypothetical protein
MQEHIRRAHPNHYIPKLPATEESFLLMVNTPLDQRAHLNTQPTPSPAKKYDTSPPVTPRTIDDAHPAAATAAVALAQLHHHRLASDWDEMVGLHIFAMNNECSYEFYRTHTPIMS